MRSTSTLTALLLVLGMFAASGAAADENCRLIRGAETTTTDDDVEICRAERWFADSGAKVGNVAAQDGQFPTWDDTAPDTSVAGGAGGGYASSSLHQLTAEYDPTYTATFLGQAEGPIDNVKVRMYLFPLQNMAEQAIGDPAGGTYSIDANLIAGGKTVGFAGGVVSEVADGGSAVKVVEFSFRDLYNRGLVDGTHDLELQLTGTGIASELAVWVYDTTEAPSSLVFNATDDELDGVAF